MRKRILITTLLCMIFSGVAFASNDETIAEILGWHSGNAPAHKEECNLCDGYYTEPAAIAEVPNPPNPKTVPATITAAGPITFSDNGVSVLRKNIVIRQPGRIIYADKALVYRNKAGKITHMTLIGHVKVEENGKILAGKKAEYDVSNDTFTLDDAIYRIVGEHFLLTTTTKFNAWGTAKKIHQRKNGIIDLTDATYSTCAPIDPSWVMDANHIHLDRASGEGYADNTVVRFKHVPILYAPYYTFPLNDKRKSGLLPPSGGYSSGHGSYISIPYYWNMAPNYDAIITPQWYTDRGMQLNTNFRYLTAMSNGSLYASIVPNDRAFVQFKQDTLSQYAGNTSPTLAPYLTQLQNSKHYRGFFDFENNVNFNPQWNGVFDARYVSDPYFAENFQSEYLGQNVNQVPSFAQLNYQGEHWQHTFWVQGYQTLHPIDQLQNAAQNQYMRLPEWDMNAAYPDFIPHFNFDLSAQAVHFAYESDFSPLTYQVPIGNRIHLQPSISRPFVWSDFYIKPKITADSTSYFTQLASSSPYVARQNYSSDRTLPIVDVDSAMHFDRIMQIGSQHYMQTLSPRIFYLYTPYLNQDAYPNFDTQLLPFSTTDLFSLNQFTGYDRLQNADQMSFGLTSNVLRTTDASDVFNTQIGFIDYFEKPSVCLVQGCTPSAEAISPVAGSATWNPNALWSITSQAAWDAVLDQMNNAQINVQYHTDERHIIVLGYQFAEGNPDTPFDQFGFSTNTSLATAGIVWPLSFHWHFFGYTYYDLTHSRPQNQYVGLSYSTCCWAVRTIVADNFTGTLVNTAGTSYQNQYSSGYYIEFLLKGLGSVGNRRAEDMLTQTLPGFTDVFSSQGHYGYS